MLALDKEDRRSGTRHVERFREIRGQTGFMLPRFGRCRLHGRLEERGQIARRDLSCPRRLGGGLHGELNLNLMVGLVVMGVEVEIGVGDQIKQKPYEQCR